ncbi:oxidoreductase OrdL 1 [Phlyctema vagabunda]|uniref:Oxidoreductase OrdL 1 n=1 Tax=Phlyctema vagabunda TaxID=108571 RepID=A0ABR4PID9_9HELO
MGVIQSRIRDVYLSIQTLVVALSEMNADFNALLARIDTKPGLPVSDPTSSFWLTSPPFPELTKMQSEKLPSSSAVVIIGSGITGASIAFTLLEECKAMGIEKSVLMLEARDITSGATGRNGGHIKVAPYELFSQMKSKLGVEQAKKIVGFQMMHLKVLPSLAREKGWGKAEAREVETVDLFLDDAALLKAKAELAELHTYMPELGKGFQVWDAQEAQKRFSAGTQIKGALSYTAGALWPFRFVTSCLSYLLASYPSLVTVETRTPVTDITVSSSSNNAYPYVLHTPRGKVSAACVIHATEAHASTLISGLRGKLFGVRGTMSAQRPGLDFPRTHGERSWSFIHAKGFDYITQRPAALTSDEEGSEVMTGGGLMLGGRGMDEIGVLQDNDIRTDIGAYLGGILPMVFGAANWGEDAPGGRMKGLWTGTMGFSADGFPFVGRLHESLTSRKITKGEKEDVDIRGEWISAGYGGEGMPQAWLCGVACALMVLGREGVSLEGKAGRPGGKLADWFPEEMLVSKARVARANVNELAGEL